MRMRCVACGRITVPAAYIGTEAVGPRCAKRLNLVGMAKAGGRIRFTKTKPVRETGPQTLDLFDDHDPQPSST